jgi:maltokinase
MTTVGDLLREWMPSQRWFGGKGRAWADVTEKGFFLDRGTPTLSVHRVQVTYADGGSDTYLVPLSWRDHGAEELSSAFIGALLYEGREVYAYDAMRDRDATPPWLTHLVNASTVGPLHFHPAGVAYIPEGVPGDIVSTEQSNTSLVYGQEAIFKLFRRLEPGLNPDVEIHDALRRTQNAHIAPLLGHIEIDGPDPATPPATVAMLQTFVPNASDGWQLATASVRDLYAEGDLHADEVGGDFAADSERLGAATASVHADLAKVLPTEEADDTWYATVARQMAERLAAAIEIVPPLAEHADRLQALYAEVADSREPVVRQRVHGDLHLGQVLRTTTGWILLDFEGEPARPLAERRVLDSPLRDVAGMLRSFDYAARHMLVEQPDDAQRAYRAQEWAERNRDAFCAGYSGAGGLNPCGESPLLRAFEADKAVYECVYEARNRPHWLMIPLHSLSRLTGRD